MRTLYAKELRSQWPFVGLLLFLTIVPYIAGAFSESLGLRPLDEFYGEGLIHIGFDWVFTAFVICIGISYGLLVREIDDRTIEFLDSLPVSRTQLFIAKWLAAMTVLTILPVLDSFCMIAIRSFTLTSLDRSYHFNWVDISMFLQWMQLFCFFSIGLVLSFFRRFGWLLIGIIGWGFLILGRFVPSLQIENLSMLVDAQFAGQRWLFPWSLVSGYLMVGVLSSLVAWGLFLGGGPIILKILAGSESRLKQAFLIATSVVICFVFIGAMMTSMAFEEEEGEYDAVRENFPSWTTASRTTRHFSAVYPTNLSSRANDLLDRADETYEKVADFFDVKDDMFVQMDMTSYSSHALGTAYWDKIRMDLTAHPSLPELVQTLGHETTHVVLESLADNQLRENFGSARFFHEGVATYIERRLFSDQDLVQQRLGAAVLCAREEVSFDRLVEDDRLRKEHDTYLAYSLGEVFAAAVVARFGDDALPKLARTFAIRKHTEGLSGVTLWRSVFQAAGMSLSETLDEYYRLLEEATEVHAATITQLPELYPIVDLEDGVIWLSIDHEPPTDWRIVIRFRSSANALDDSYWTQWLEGGQVVARRSDFVGRLAWYQVGYAKPNAATIFQPWQSIRLP